jgi:salicylate hydroxylase
MGPDGHILTFPVNHGSILNIVAFRTTTENWSDPQRLVKPATQEDALRDYEGYGTNVIKLLKLTKPNLDVVSSFGLNAPPSS